jgi:hypothetical protein
MDKELIKAQIRMQDQAIEAMRHCHTAVDTMIRGQDDLKKYFPELLNDADRIQNILLEAKSLFAGIINEIITNPRYPLNY